RTLWATEDPPGRSFEVTGGLVRELERPNPPSRAFSPEELRRLGEILEKETYAPLRDAASLALAPHRDPSPRPRLPSLAIHEWGVFGDGGEVLVPPETLLADLPGFVHRSGVTAATL